MLNKLRKNRFVKSILRTILLCLLGTFILFLLVQTLPGDAATRFVGKVEPEALELIRERMGLNQPPLLRYWYWLKNLLGGSFGTTMTTDLPVSDVIRLPFRATLIVSGFVLVGVVFVTLPLAIYEGAQMHPRRHILSKLSLMPAAMPEFVVAILLLAVLAQGAGWLPVLSIPKPGASLWDSPQIFVLPVLSLWLIVSANLFRRVAALVRTYASSAYVRDARLAGMSEWRVIFVHLLPSAAYGIGQLLALTVPYLLGGAVVVETVFSFPGMGYLLVQSINSRETTVVMAIGLIQILYTAVGLWLADIAGAKNERISQVV